MSSMDRKEIIRNLEKTMSNTSTEAIFFHQAVADTLGLNITDHKCVNFISRNGPMTAGKLAELAGITTGAVTGVIDRLEKAGFVKRVKHPDDRRLILVELTKEKIAEEKLRTIFYPLSQKMQKVFENFTDDEAHAYN